MARGRLFHPLNRDKKAGTAFVIQRSSYRTSVTSGKEIILCSSSLTLSSSTCLLTYFMLQSLSNGLRIAYSSSSRPRIGNVALKHRVFGQHYSSSLQRSHKSILLCKLGHEVELSNDLRAAFAPATIHVREHTFREFYCKTFSR